MANSRKWRMLRGGLALCWRPLGRLFSEGPSAAAVADFAGATLGVFGLLGAALLQWLPAILFITPMAKNPWSIVGTYDAMRDFSACVFGLGCWFALGACEAAVAVYLTGRGEGRRIPWLGIFGTALAVLLLFHPLVLTRQWQS